MKFGRNAERKVFGGVFLFYNVIIIPFFRIWRNSLPQCFFALADISYM